jgi:hypothetical protein
MARDTAAIGRSASLSRPSEGVCGSFIYYTAPVAGLREALRLCTIVAGKRVAYLIEVVAPIETVITYYHRSACWNDGSRHAIWRARRLRHLEMRGSGSATGWRRSTASGDHGSRVSAVSAVAPAVRPYGRRFRLLRCSSGRSVL